MNRIAVFLFATNFLVLANTLFEQPPTEHLTDQNFQEKVLNSSDPWIVAVYWNLCKHSKRYSKEVWPEIISTFDNSNIRFGALEQRNQEMVHRFQKFIPGYPTVLVFRSNSLEPLDRNFVEEEDDLVKVAH